MYGLNELQSDLEILQAQGAEIFDIGNTLLGRPIPCIFKGSKIGGQTLLHASIHAREWVTTPLVIEMMKNYNGSYGVWCVPMVNIDGVLLVQQGLSSIPEQSLKDFLKEVNGGSEDFSLWKANARAVDLNVNFNARWGEGAQNVTYPAPANYIGEHPFSEYEIMALRSLTERVKPSVTLSYHAKGNVIYKGFGCIDNGVECAQRISDSTGYPLLNSYNSVGGYKDWYVATFQKLGLTIEVGDENVAYAQLIDYLPQIYEQNANVLNIATECAQNE
ncbi:MAG: hypothetical protein HDT29_06525 [Clostridiales bacterium]|nr:hypothetical protein [Clostridiales bacterium]